MRRPGLLVLALAVSGVVSLAGCTAGSVKDGIAAFSVDGHDTSQKSVDKELEELAENDKLREFVEQPSQGGQPLVLSRSDGSIDASLAAGWLSQLIALDLVEQEIDRQGVEITAADRAHGHDLAVQVVGDAATFDTFSQSFQDDMTERWSAVAAAQRRLLSSDSVDQVLAQQCPSGRYASHILVATQAEAEQAKTQIEGGADFADVAQQRSTDTGSATNGGELGCIDGQQFVEPFATAAVSQPIGEISDPVQTEFGFHLILVTDKPPQAESLDRATLDQILTISRGKQVEVDPRYGTWDRQNGRVLPPGA